LAQKKHGTKQNDSARKRQAVRSEMQIDAGQTADDSAHIAGAIRSRNETETERGTMMPSDVEVIDAERDPTLPIRNFQGHFVTCNYGDWFDFTKCDCGESLIGMPERNEAFQISPLPLRDTFAMAIDIPLDQAIELAALLKKGEQKIETVDLITGGEPMPLTMREVAEARARLRYLEADAMIERRRAADDSEESNNAG
jgi:hypothetical protein